MPLSGTDGGTAHMSTIKAHLLAHTCGGRHAQPQLVGRPSRRVSPLGQVQSRRHCWTRQVDPGFAHLAVEGVELGGPVQGEGGHAILIHIHQQAVEGGGELLQALVHPGSRAVHPNAPGWSARSLGPVLGLAINSWAGRGRPSNLRCGERPGQHGKAVSEADPVHGARNQRQTEARGDQRMGSTPPNCRRCVAWMR